MEIKLREYQQPFYDDIMRALYIKNVDKVCAVLPTGGGKSVLIAKLCNNLKGRTLILTHRIEILNQNLEWFENASFLTSKKESLRYDSKIVIAMVQTAHARIKKYGVHYLGHFDNIVLDEVQVLIFEKVFKEFNFTKLVGFTATPIINKKITTELDGVEFVQDYTLSEMFNELIQGPDSQDLIDLGFLCQDFNVELRLPNFDKLVSSDNMPDGYTTKSLNDVYANTASVDILLKAYEKYGKGKKTLIFNATTKVNEVVLNSFRDKGIVCQSYDSVNANDLSRNDVIDWFNKQSDAVLINTNVFTTGFNVPEVECVIVNRATKSLSLWIQMVGRGSRTTDKIYKENFTVIDMGENILTHGMWSARRNWSNYFYPNPPRRKNKMDMIMTWECQKCGAYNIAGESKCDSCGAIREQKPRTKKSKDGELIEIEAPKPPKGNLIVKYCQSNKLDANFAFRLAEKKIIELFVLHKVDKNFYTKNRKRFMNRIFNIYRPIYFAILNSNLEGANKKLETQLNKLATKIDKMYE